MDTARPIPPDAQARLTHRRRRRGAIRRGIAVAGVSAFALVWGVIARTGSMGATTATASSSTATSAATTSSADPSATTEYDYGSGSDDGDSSSSQTAASPVTTQTS
jgi:hypothetical protein